MCWTAADDGRRPTSAPPRSPAASRPPNWRMIGDEIGRRPLGPEPASARARWPCSTPCAPTSRWPRLAHYTGAPAEHVQHYVLFTNYHRYVDEFVRWGCAELRREGRPLRAAVLRRRGGDHPRHARSRSASPPRRLAPAPDAGLPPDRRGPAAASA